MKLFLILGAGIATVLIVVVGGARLIDDATRGDAGADTPTRDTEGYLRDFEENVNQWNVYSPEERPSAERLIAYGDLACAAVKRDLEASGGQQRHSWSLYAADQIDSELLEGDSRYALDIAGSALNFLCPIVPAQYR